MLSNTSIQSHWSQRVCYIISAPLPNTKETYDIHVMVKIIINKDTNYGRRTAIVATDNENGVFPGQFRHLFPNEESKRKACAFLELPADVAADVICFDADRFMEFFPQYSQVKQRSRFHGMFRTNHHRVYEDWARQWNCELSSASYSATVHV